MKCEKSSEEWLLQRYQCGEFLPFEFFFKNNQSKLKNNCLCFRLIIEKFIIRRVLYRVFLNFLNCSIHFISCFMRIFISMCRIKNATKLIFTVSSTENTAFQTVLQAKIQFAYDTLSHFVHNWFIFVVRCIEVCVPCIHYPVPTELTYIECKRYD